jgi:hypothetical protein
MTKRWKKKDYVQHSRYMDAKNNIDVYYDIDERHEIPHKDDPQIDYMYMRQSKKRKSLVDTSKSKHNGDDLAKAALDLTKIGVVGIMGMGLIGTMGGMLRKKKPSKSKAKKGCGCKK